MEPLFDIAPFNQTLPELASKRPEALEELETILGTAIPAPGVYRAAFEAIHRRFQGLEVWVPRAGSSTFIRECAFQVALAATVRGFPPLEAFELGARASEALKTHYGPAQVYIPMGLDRFGRYNAILADADAVGTDNAALKHGVSFQTIVRLRRWRLSARRQVRAAS